MYPEKNLYSTYKKLFDEKDLSSFIPDITKKRTLDLMNTAVNCSESWDYALDIGGGSGHYGLPLIEKFKEVTLIEPDIYEEHAVFDKKFKNFSVIHSMVKDVTLESKVDFILLADVFEHIPGIEGFVSQLSRFQETGGVVYIMTPNPLFCGPAVESILHHSKIGSHGHIRHYFKHEVVNIMKEGGYDLVHFSYEEYASRANARRIIKGISRRDKTFSKFLIYRNFFGPIIRTLLKPYILAIESSVYKREKQNQDNTEDCMSSVFVFKKI